jgi:hypothetical protein
MHDRDRPNASSADPDPESVPGTAPVEGADDNAQTAAPAAPAAPSAAVIRFQSCRWRKTVNGDIPAHCGHPEVLPFAGVNGFSADSWCPDCQFYKLRRTPTKRDDYDRY